MVEEKTALECTGWLHPLADCVTRQPALCLCLSCYWFWQLFYFQSPASFAEAGGALTVDGRLVLLLSSCAAYAIAWWQHRRLAAVAAKPWYPWLVGIAMAGGTLLQGMAPWLPSSGVGNVMLCAGSGAMGVGAALFIVELSRVFAQLGSRFALLAGVVGLFGCTVPFFLATVMSDVGKGLLLAGAAVGSLVAWRATMRQFPRGRFYRWGLETKLHIPLKLTLTCFAQGLALGIMTSFLTLKSSGALHPVVYVAAVAVGARGVVGTADARRLDVKHLLYQVGFPLMGLGFLMQVCFPASIDAAGFMFSVAHCYVYILMTCICSYFSNCLKCSPAWIVSLITLAMVGGQMTGTIGVDVGAAVLGPSATDASSAAASLAFLLPTAALLLLSSDNTASGWGAIRPAERAGDRGDAALFAKIASDYQLTVREREICEYLSRGRNKRYISEQLDVAEETVKTHMGNLYRKLLVHSQQEIIDLVEAERSAWGR